MSGSVQDRAEILRLARLLRKRPEELSFLLDVPDAELVVFRDQVTDALFDAHTAVIKRLASAAKLLPAPVLAKIGEKVFGPLLCARIAGEIDPGKATDVAKRLSLGFLTEVAIELDPRRAQRIIEQIPTATIVAVARELAAREDWITLGRFVGHLPQEKVAAALREVTDVQVLRTAFAVDDVSAVATVIDLIPQSRLTSLIDAASREDLWPTLLSIAERLRDDQVEELAELLAQQDESVRSELRRVAQSLGVLDRLGPIAEVLGEAAA